jgi:hypothetical protein
LRNALPPLLARGAGGFLFGLAVWWTLSVPYTHFVAAPSEALIRIGERPSATTLVTDGTELTLDRNDFPRAAQRPGLQVMDLTSNFILLATLFAVNRRPLSDRNVGGFLLASLALAAVHIGAVILNVESMYALRLGAWSARHYGAVARNVWGAGAHFYSLIGAFGASFALWWLFRPTPEPAPHAPSRAPRRAPRSASRV